MTLPSSPTMESTARYTDMMARYVEPVVMAAFEDDDVTEIYVNPQDGVIRLDTISRGKVETNGTIDATRVEMFLNTVAMYAKTTLSADRPALQAELPCGAFRGSRLQGFVPPLTCGPTFTIRKPPSTIYSLEHYVQRGALSTMHRAAIRDAIDAHRNILVIGATNSGKTTFANAVLKEITDRFPLERIVVLEDTVELQCPAPDSLALRTTTDISLAQLVKMTLRTSPNRIVVGEVRDAAALDLLDAWATGHPGGVATLHANTPEGALLRLDRLAQRANVPSQTHLIAEAIQLIVVMTGDANGRRVSHVVQVTGVDGRGRFTLARCSEQPTDRTAGSPTGRTAGTVSAAVTAPATGAAS